MPNGWITVGEAAERLERTPSLVRRLIIQGRLKARKVGPVWTINAKALDAFMALERPPGRPAKRRRRKQEG